MKNCQCCLRGCEDEAHTCPSCGEASWGAVVAPEPVKVEPPEEANDHEPEEEPEPAESEEPAEPEEPEEASVVESEAAPEPEPEEEQPAPAPEPVAAKKPARKGRGKSNK